MVVVVVAHVILVSAQVPIGLGFFTFLGLGLGLVLGGQGLVLGLDNCSLDSADLTWATGGEMSLCLLVMHSGQF